jgi:hypothetical protein
MAKLKLEYVKKYVEGNIGSFHKKRLERLKQLKFSDVLLRKNPYLFKAKNVLTAQDLIKNLLDAYLSSQEETIFGDFVEGLAIFICERVYEGKKSAAEGIDLEFEKDNIKYIVTIKSGPNWGNSSQQNKMKENFRKAKRILKTNSEIKHIVAVNGCCYGRDNKPEKEEFIKLCGERFWEFISGNKNLYIEIIEPLGHKAKEKNEEFIEEYSRLINSFTFDFSKEFCMTGKIDWEKLVKFNSAIIKPKNKL